MELHVGSNIIFKTAALCSSVRLGETTVLPVVTIETGAVLARGRYFADVSIPTCHVIKSREGLP